MGHDGPLSTFDVCFVLLSNIQVGSVLSHTCFRLSAPLLLDIGSFCALLLFILIPHSHLSECFNHTLVIKKELTRYKHWFQFNDPSHYPHDTLVVAQFRNPCDWFKAMERVPHHSPAHLRTALQPQGHPSEANNDWKIFLTKPWTMERIGSDLWSNRTSETACQQHFPFRDIISCDLEPLPHSHYKHTIRYSEHQPFYEMRNDGSGLPHDNILEMRTDKIRNFMSVADYQGVADVWVVQYEYLLAKGTQHLIDRIAEWTGQPAHCQGKPPQVRVPKKSRRVSPEFARHVRLHLNWTVEDWIGYKPDLKREVQEQDW